MSDSESIVTPGMVLAERYRLSREIGRGGFGMVYLARQLNMDRDVAIKILPPKFMSISDVVERFRREARLASRLRHPNTITVHDYGKQDNLLFIVMEFLEGEDLADVLMRKATVPMDRILHIGCQVLKSLHEAHQHKIVHRDLKPENIFLTQVGGEEDYVKVLDFGIAKLAMPEVNATEGKKLRKLTMSGSTVGTPTYMSPEQAAGEEVDALSDLYALGVILYEMACGRPPYRDDNPIKVMRSHLFEELPRFPEGPLRDSRFEWVIRKALAKEKEDRFESAAEFLKALDVSPKDMLERATDGDEPATVELPDLDISSDELDSRDIAFDRTAAYEVEGSDALSLRSTHETGSTLAAQNASSSAPFSQTGSHESIPFQSVPDRRRRDRVPEGATSSSLTDSSGLTTRSDLHESSAPPAGLESNASTSSIVTVLEPGPKEDVILLTNKKAESSDSAEIVRADTNQPNRSRPDTRRPDTDQPDLNHAAPAEPEQRKAGPPPRALPEQVAPKPPHPQTPRSAHAAAGEARRSEWTWGEEKRSAQNTAAQSPGTDEMAYDPRVPRRSSLEKALIALVFILLAAAAAVGYLHYIGRLEWF